jgi:hypothetical protein
MVIFGYAATFDVRDIPTELVGHDSPAIRTKLAANNAFSVVSPVAATARRAIKRLFRNANCCLTYFLNPTA